MLGLEEAAWQERKEEQHQALDSNQRTLSDFINWTDIENILKSFVPGIHVLIFLCREKKFKIRSVGWRCSPI